MTSEIAFPCWIIGLMSGTSADGVDAALLWTDGSGIAKPGPSLFVPYDEKLRADIFAAMNSGDGSKVARPLTEIHLQAVRQLLAQTKETVQLIGFHGQTITHRPHEHTTLQVGDAQYLADQAGIPVIHDFRSADVAAGGQGAPLVPLFHAALAAKLEHPIMVVNIGGVANVTYINKTPSPPAGEGWGEGAANKVMPHANFTPPPPNLLPQGEEELQILAFDCGPGNALIDDWVRRHTGARCDEGGALAAKGKVDEVALAAFLADPFFETPAPKSLDRNHFQYVTPSNDGVPLGEPMKRDPVVRRGDKRWSLEDGAATLTAMTAAAIAEAVRLVPSPPKQVLICGGGRHNPTLMEMLKKYQIPALPVEKAGWNGDMLEAEAFAYLAARSAQGLPLSLPSTTGVPKPMTGGHLCVPGHHHHHDDDDDNTSPRTCCH